MIFSKKQIGIESVHKKAEIELTVLDEANNDIQLVGIVLGRLAKVSARVSIVPLSKFPVDTFLFGQFLRCRKLHKFLQFLQFLQLLNFD